MKNILTHWKVAALLIAGSAFGAVPAMAHDMASGEMSDSGAKSGETVTVTGEVLDMACYVDHGAKGADHADCASMCIESGLPVGLQTTDGKTYLLIGDHKPANDELAQYAAKTITVRGKLVSRDGINMLENIEIVKM